MNKYIDFVQRRLYLWSTLLVISIDSKHRHQYQMAISIWTQNQSHISCSKMFSPTRILQVIDASNKAFVPIQEARQTSKKAGIFRKNNTGKELPRKP